MSYLKKLGQNLTDFWFFTEISFFTRVEFSVDAFFFLGIYSFSKNNDNLITSIK